MSFDTHFIVRVEFSDGTFAHFVLESEFYGKYFFESSDSEKLKNLAYCPSISRYFVQEDISSDFVKTVSIWSIHNR